MTDALLTEAVDELFTATVTPEVIEAAEASGWADGIWAQVATMGLPWISVPEQAGGEGGTLLDALAVLRLAGRHAVPLPLAEAGVLAGWLLAAAGLPIERVPTTVTADEGLRADGHRVTGVAHRVPWGAAAQRLVVLAGGAVFVFDPAALRIERHRNLAGEPSDTVHFDHAVPLAVAAAGPGVERTAFWVRAALTRVVLMAGALRRVSELTTTYVEQRVQFGRPIGRFQAVQQHVVHVGQQSALLDLAAAQAGAIVAAGADPASARFAVLCAKGVADEAATIGTRAAHQAHGAMGMTREYPLHHVTRRLWAWTRQSGTGGQTAIELGTLAAGAGADGLWPLLAG
ncbi:acyl-CoA dehydrogenase family protein [Dactylosporangium sp. CA-092794]|uniref:acyl-CoA dehydrogenase family protein n=1 Tax=Dactylosporangium sp. CA-092794 TaxID=3239929 RepID=UPI003D8DB327